MTFNRRTATAALAASLVLTGGLVRAQSSTAETGYPSKPIRLLVPYSAGGGSDILARLIGEQLRQRMGQPVIVDNRPGGNTAIAMRALQDSPPDGYTLLLGTTALATVPAGTPAAFDPMKFAHIGRLSGILLVLVANPNVPVKSLSELIALAKASPGKFTVATSSIGGSDHLTALLFNQRAGVDIRVIPYKGAAPAITDLLGGQVDLRWDAMPSSRPHIDSGKLKALGVAELKRSPMAPNIPAVAEQGVPNFEAPGFYGMIAPLGTPAPIVSRLNRELNDIIKLPDVHARMFELGLEPIGSTPEQFTQLIKTSLNMWGKVIKDANLKIE